MVDDDPALSEMLGIVLRGEGLEAVFCSDGSRALEEFRLRKPDVVLLDVMLPGLDGIQVAQQIRAESGTPIVMLTARSDTVDVVLGLESGADDYVVKPFGMRELVARIRAVSRRTANRAEPEAAAPAGDSAIVVGRLEVDLRAHRVRIDGTEISLTPKEFELVAYLARDPGAVFTRERIMDDVWDPHWFGPTKTLDVHVASLRRKLGDPGWVETVRGVGFRLQPVA